MIQQKITFCRNTCWLACKVLLLAIFLVACGPSAKSTKQPIALTTVQPSVVQQPSIPLTTTFIQLDATPLPTDEIAHQLTPTPRTFARPTQPSVTSSAKINTSMPVPQMSTRTSVAQVRSEIVFLKGGSLVAWNGTSRQERIIASDVSEFTATPNGHMLALVRNVGLDREIWLVERDGSNLRQLTRNNRAEGQLSFAPDGTDIVYASTESDQQRPLEWMAWAEWCKSSQIRLLSLATQRETPFDHGCDPSFSPDGRRIAFATPPQRVERVGQQADVPNVANTIRLINRKGEHGWSFAVAKGSDTQSGRLVYAPTWMPNGTKIAYHRFIGYQALVDISYTEMGGSFEGKGTLIGAGAGWLLPPRFSPDSKRAVVIEYDPGNARGVQGYESWRMHLLNLEVPGNVSLPEGELPTLASRIQLLGRVTGADWSPDGKAMVVALPANWSAETSQYDAVYENTSPGALWLLSPGNVPSEPLVQGVDYASPVLWLP